MGVSAVRQQQGEEEGPEEVEAELNRPSEPQKGDDSWISGILPGGNHDVTHAVASAASWARERDIEQQKAEMERRIQEAIAEEARQKELASEAASARQAKELAALGVKSDDSDDIATRILVRPMPAFISPRSDVTDRVLCCHSAAVLLHEPRPGHECVSRG